MLISKCMMSNNSNYNNKQLQYKYCPISQYSNQAMKLGQLIECNLRNIFVEKLYTKYAGETITRALSKKPTIAHISGSIVFQSG